MFLAHHKQENVFAHIFFLISIYSLVQTTGKDRTIGGHIVVTCLLNSVRGECQTVERRGGEREDQVARLCFS